MKNVRAVLKMAIVTAGGYGRVIFGIMTIFADGILRLFMDATAGLWRLGLHIAGILLCLLLMGINIAGSYFLQAILKTKEALFSFLLRGFVQRGC